MKVYIQAKSKKEINEWLSEGKEIEAIEYNMFGKGDYKTYRKLQECPEGTIVALFTKYGDRYGNTQTDDGDDFNPISKSWGVWQKMDNKIK